MKLIIIGFIVYFICLTSVSQSEDLVLNLKLDKEKILLCEPIRLSVYLLNSSEKEIEITPQISTLLKYYCSYEEQIFNLCGAGSSRGKNFLPTILLPGEMRKDSGDELLFLSQVNSSGKPKFVFDKKGNYAVKARLPISGGYLESNIIQVEVDEPPPEEKDALNLITTKEAARMILGWDLKKENAAVLQELIEKYPKSVYADHAYFGLGRYFRLQSFLEKTEEKDPSLKAFESFSKVSERVPALKTRALLRQAELIKRYPELKERVDVPKLIEELEKKSDTAKEIGMEKETAELQEELKKLIKPEDDK